MKHFWTKTDSVPWAVSLAGARSKSPKEYSISLVSDQPVVKFISESMSGGRVQGEEIKLPETEQELEWLDLAQAARLQREMAEIQGLVMDQKIQTITLQYPQLASTLLMMKHQTYASHGYYCPDPRDWHRKQVRPYEEYTVLVENEQYVDRAQSWAQGFGLEEFNVLDLSKLGPLEQVYALGALNRGAPGLVVLSAHHDLNWVARAWYTDFMGLVQRPCILSVLPANEQDIDRRRCLYWSQQIPVLDVETPEQYVAKGLAWRIRWDCKFDNHEYYRRRARGEFQD